MHKTTGQNKTSPLDCQRPATPADLVILPAAGAAWQISVGDGEHQVSLVGAQAVVPLPKAGPASQASAGSALDGHGHAVLQFDWCELWYATLRVQSRQGLDLRPYRGGTLEFELDVVELAQGSLKLRLDCAEGCGRSVNLIEQARAWAGQGWQQVALAVRCFERDEGDLSCVVLPFALEGAGSGRVRVRNVRFRASGTPTITCSDFRSETITPAVAKEHYSIDTWLARHAEKLREKDRMLAAGTPPQLVFVGDSITEGWEGDGRDVWQRHFAAHHALALGVGGDRTENLLWRLQNGQIDGLAPKVVVMMIGTNNAGMHPPQMTAAGIARLAEEIRQRLPGAQLLLLGIFPRGETPADPLRAVNGRVNALVAGLADGNQVHFLDIGQAFLAGDGSLPSQVMPDFLHLSAQGYALWQQAMAPVLQRLMAPAP